MPICPNCGEDWPPQWPRCFSCGFDGPRPGGGGGERGEVDSRTQLDGELELDLSPDHARAAEAPVDRTGRRSPSSLDSPAARRAAERARKAARAELTRTRVGGWLKSAFALVVFVVLVVGGIVYWPQIRSWWGSAVAADVEKKRTLGADWGGFACDRGGTPDRMFCQGWVKNEGKTPILFFRVDVVFGARSLGDDRVRQTLEVGPIPPGEQVKFREGWPIPSDQADKHEFTNIRVER